MPSYYCASKALFYFGIWNLHSICRLAQLACFVPSHAWHARVAKGLLSTALIFETLGYWHIMHGTNYDTTA